MFTTEEITDAEVNASRALRLVLKAQRLGKRASAARAQRLLDKWQDMHEESNIRMVLNQQRVLAGLPIVLRPVRSVDVAPMTDADIPF